MHVHLRSHLWTMQLSSVPPGCWSDGCDGLILCWFLWFCCLFSSLWHAKLSPSNMVLQQLLLQSLNCSVDVVQAMTV